MFSLPPSPSPPPPARMYSKTRISRRWATRQLHPTHALHRRPCHRGAGHTSWRSPSERWFPARPRARVSTRITGLATVRRPHGLLQGRCLAIPPAAFVAATPCHGENRKSRCFFPWPARAPLFLGRLAFSLPPSLPRSASSKISSRRSMEGGKPALGGERTGGWRPGA